MGYVWESFVSYIFLFDFFVVVIVVVVIGSYVVVGKFGREREKLELRRDFGKGYG